MSVPVMVETELQEQEIGKKNKNQSVSNYFITDEHYISYLRIEIMR